MDWRNIGKHGYVIVLWLLIAASQPNFLQIDELLIILGTIRESFLPRRYRIICHGYNYSIIYLGRRNNWGYKRKNSKSSKTRKMQKQ